MPHGVGPKGLGGRIHDGCGIEQHPADRGARPQRSSGQRRKDDQCPHAVTDQHRTVQASLLADRPDVVGVVLDPHLRERLRDRLAVVGAAMTDSHRPVVLGVQAFAVTAQIDFHDPVLGAELVAQGDHRGALAAPAVDEHQIGGAGAGRTRDGIPNRASVRMQYRSHPQILPRLGWWILDASGEAAECQQQTR